MKGLGKRGVTLAYLIIIIAILSLLGVTLLSAAMTGFRLKVISGNSRKAFYIAEAGLEQANAVIESTMTEAVDYAKDQARAEFDKTLLEERKKQEIDRQDKTKLYENKYRSPYFYHRRPAVTGHKNTYDFFGNITGEVDIYGNEVPITLIKINPSTMLLEDLDSKSVYDSNAKLDGLVQPYADKVLNALFAKYYTDYLENGIPKVKESLEQRLEKVGTFQSSSHENSGDDVTSVDAEVDGFGTLVQGDDGLFAQTVKANTMEVIFRTTGKANSTGASNSVSRKLQTRFVIGIPPYDSPILKGNEIVKLKSNALFDKALCSEKDIVVLGKNVTVNGNVYAKGHDILPSDTDSFRYGGIIVGDALAFSGSASYSDLSKKEGKLTVNGMVSTPSYLQTRNNNSSIDINGNVYCNSLVAQQDWETNEDGVYSGANILLRHDLNILDNLNINCTNTKVEVDGNFIGFSDGSGVNAQHNQSSSIVINDEDLNTNDTSLIINGDGDPIEYSFYDEPSGKTVNQSMPKGIYIAGTVYVNYGLEITMNSPPDSAKGSVSIDSEGGWKYTPKSLPLAADFTDSFTLKVHNKTFVGDDYVTVNVTPSNLEGVIASNFQTGDSISIAGNYKAYSQKLSESTVRNYAKTQYDSYIQYVELPDVCFDSVAPLYLAQRLPIYKAGVLDRQIKMKATEKSLYARMAREQDRPELTTQNLFNFGNRKVQLKSENMRFALGNFIQDSSVAGESDFQRMKSGSLTESETGLMGDTGYATYNAQLMLKSREYNYYTKKLGDPQLENYLGKNPTSIGLYDQDTIDDFFNFPENGKNNFADRRNNSADPVFYVSGKASTRPLVLCGEGGTVPTDIIGSGYDLANIKTGSGESVEGVIVTAGDVYITGSMNYKGTIISKGNIYFLDDGEKTITNDYNPETIIYDKDKMTSNDYSHFIANFKNNTVIKKILLDDLTADTDLGEMFRQDATWKKEIVFMKDLSNNILDDGTVNTYQTRLSGYIRVSQWNLDK